MWRKLKSGVLEPWSEVKLAVDTTQPAVRIQAKCASEGSREDSVTGLRSRLKVSGHAVMLREAAGKVWRMERTPSILSLAQRSFTAEVRPKM